MDADRQEQLLKMRATTDFMGDRLGDLVRYLLRTSLAETRGGSQIIKASGVLRLLLKLFERADVIDTNEIAAYAAKELRGERPSDPLGGALFDAAKSGAHYLIERSCSDNAARQRSAARLAEFANQIDQFNAVREQLRAPARTLFRSP